MVEEEAREASSTTISAVEAKTTREQTAGDGHDDDDGGHQITENHHPLLLSFRPRYLYTAVFFWISITGGRFLAPFLEHETVLLPWNDSSTHDDDENDSRTRSSSGMSAETIGLCLAMQVAVSTATGSLGGSWADAREERYPGKGRAQVMAVGISVASICFLLHGIRYLLPRPGDADADASGATSTSPSSTTLVVFFSSPAYHFGLRMVFALFSSFVFPVLDGMTISFLQNHPQQSVEDYGKERLWGAISWAITNMILACLIDWSGESFACFYPMSMVAAVSVLVTIYFFVQGQLKHRKQRIIQKRKSDIAVDDQDEGFVLDSDHQTNKKKLSIDSKTEHESSSVQTQMSTVMMLCRLLCGTVYGATFFLCLAVLSAGQAVVDSLIFLFFEFLGSSYTMMGVTVLLTVLFEIPIFHIAPILLKRYGSGALLLLATMCYVVRVLGYSSIPQGHILYVLFLEPLHGVTYACSQAASVDMAAQYTILAKAAASSSLTTSSAELDATGQGLVSGVRGIGSLLGLSFGGWAMDQLGPRRMYRASAGLVSLGTFFFAVTSYFCSPVSRYSSNDNNNHIHAEPLPQEDPDFVDDYHVDTVPDYSDKTNDGLELTLATATKDDL